MVCGAPLNYKWKQKGLSSAFSPSMIQTDGHKQDMVTDTHAHDPTHANLSAPSDPAS